MERVVRSFSVGACLHSGSFMAFLLKFRFEDGSETLTAWAKPQVAMLLEMLLEYRQHLAQKPVRLDSESIEKTIRGEAPILSQAETENLPVQAIVETATGRVQKDDVLAIAIKRAKQEQTETFLITPNQCEWVIGFTANTLNEFSEDGKLSVPSEPLH